MSKFPALHQRLLLSAPRFAARPFVIHWRYLALICFAGWFLSLSGCSCWQDPLSRARSKRPETLEEMEQRRKEQEEKAKEKPDFTLERLTVLPADDSPAVNHVKPGHWFSAVQTMQANNFDFLKGELEAECVDNVSGGKSIQLPGSDFFLQTARPVSLPKEQERHFDTLLFAVKPRRGNMMFQTRLRPRGGGRQSASDSAVTTTMRPYQNYFVVLSSRPDSYAFLKAMRCIRPGRTLDSMYAGGSNDYIVKLPKATGRIDLPSHPLTWTNIAYVVWDDFNPAVMTADQRQAMLDWLHWGGQMIISGPRSLDMLAGSMFSDCLPVSAIGTATVSQNEIDELNDRWSFTAAEFRSLSLGAETPPLKLEWELSPGASVVQGTGGLVATRNVGRGRVAVTSFSIPHERFLGWDGYDGFFNACLMGRPPRRFRIEQGDVVEVWSKLASREDPRITSTLRYFTRDASHESTIAVPRMSNPQLPAIPTATAAEFAEYDRQTNRSSNARRDYARSNSSQDVQNRDGSFANDRGSAIAESEQTAFGEESPPVEDGDSDATGTERAPPPPPAMAVSEYAFSTAGFASHDLLGVAGWNDNSDASRAARSSLSAAAGVTVPSADFIAKTMGFYLLLLVPVNWLLFRLMNRVEWAWAAVPLISILGAVAVIRVAQLDIGFARSRTEIAVIEMHPDYERAHVTRYMGLYTSLSSAYEIQGIDRTTLAQPLSSDQPVGSRRVVLYQGDRVRLSGFSVQSNSTGMVHTEQMLDMGGTLELISADDAADGGDRLTNHTSHDWQGVAVVRRTLEGQVEYAWIGDLPQNESVDLTFQPQLTARFDPPSWNETPFSSTVYDVGELNIRAILDLATDSKRLGRGETVLVGWNRESITGMEIRPAAPQVTACGVLIAHLRHAERPEPEPDANPLASLLKDAQIQTEYIEDLSAPVVPQ